MWREALNNVMEQNNDNKAVDTYMKYFLQISLSTVQTLVLIPYPQTLLMLPVLGVVVVTEVLLSHGGGRCPAEAKDSGGCPWPHPPGQRPAAHLHNHLQ